MEATEIQIEARTGSGKGGARKLRAAGRIPGVFYGPGRGSVAIAVDPHALTTAMLQAGARRMFRLRSADASELDGQMALLKDIQRDPVGRNVLHVDFYEIRMDREIDVAVPVVLKGVPVGVEMGGGTLEQVLRVIEVHCLPDRIPASIEVDVSGIEIAASLHVSDMSFPEGVRPRTDPGQAVATVVPPTTEAVAQPGAAETEGAAKSGEATKTK